MQVGLTCADVWMWNMGVQQGERWQQSPEAYLCLQNLHGKPQGGTRQSAPLSHDETDEHAFCNKARMSTSLPNGKNTLRLQYSLPKFQLIAKATEDGDALKL